MKCEELVRLMAREYRALRANEMAWTELEREGGEFRQAARRVACAVDSAAQEVEWELSELLRSMRMEGTM